MGPGLYADIGKKARELLYKDYQTDQKFAVTTYTSTGVAITASGTQKNDLILGEIHSQLKNKGVTVDLKANSKSDLLTTVAIDNLGAPGLKAIFSFAIPDHRSGKAEVQYLHDYAGVNASVGLADKPIINFAGVLGTSSASAGVDVAFDAATGNFTKCNAALSVTHTDLMAALTLNNKGESLTGSYYHIVYPVSNTAVGAEVTHNFSTKEDVITFGTQHSMDPLTTVKARLNSYGKASALIQHEWRPKSFVTLSTEVDTKAIEKSSKVGLSVLLKP